MALAHDDLRGHVAGGARCVFQQIGAYSSGNPEIRQPQIALLVEYYVLGLDVSVHDSLRMDDFQTLALIIQYDIMPLPFYF